MVIVRFLLKAYGAAKPAKFYFNSASCHRNCPDKKVTKADAIVAEMGSLEGSNHRNINKMLVCQVVETCQLQGYDRTATREYLEYDAGPYT